MSLPKLPMTADFADDVKGVSVAAALARLKVETRRHARIEAKAEAMPAGPKKDRLRALLERAYIPAAQSAEDALAEAVLDLRAPSPAFAWETGASAVQVGRDLVVVVADLAEDGSPTGRESPRVFVVPAGSQARVVADRRFMIPQWLRDRRERAIQAEADDQHADPAA